MHAFAAFRERRNIPPQTWCLWSVICRQHEPDTHLIRSHVVSKEIYTVMWVSKEMYAVMWCQRKYIQWCECQRKYTQWCVCQRKYIQWCVCQMKFIQWCDCQRKYIQWCDCQRKYIQWYECQLSREIYTVMWVSNVTYTKKSDARWLYNLKTFQGEFYSCSNNENRWEWGIKLLNPATMH